MEPSIEAVREAFKALLDDIVLEEAHEAAIIENDARERSNSQSCPEERD